MMCKCIYKYVNIINLVSSTIVKTIFVRSKEYYFCVMFLHVGLRNSCIDALCITVSNVTEPNTLL